MEKIKKFTVSPERSRLESIVRSGLRQFEGRLVVVKIENCTRRDWKDVESSTTDY